MPLVKEVVMTCHSLGMAFETLKANKTYQIMKKTSITLIAILFSIGIVACSGNSSNWEKEKEELTAKIDRTIDNVDEAIQEINNDLKDASEDAAESLREKKEDLLNQKSTLERTKEDIADATEEAWEDTKNWAEKAYTDVEDFLKGNNS